MIVTKIYTRPSTDVSWFDPGEDYMKYWSDNYVQTNKVVVSILESANGLIRTVETRWLVNRDNYLNDNILTDEQNDRIVYNLINKIDMKVTERE
jgi:hypothetical protein